MELCKVFVKAIQKYNTNLLPLLSKKQQHDMSNLNNRRVREEILKDASSVYPVKMSDFDRDPMLFNCRNGTFNLLTDMISSY